MIAEWFTCMYDISFLGGHLFLNFVHTLWAWTQGLRKIWIGSFFLLPGCRRWDALKNAQTSVNINFCPIFSWFGGVRSEWSKEYNMKPLWPCIQSLSKQVYSQVYRCTPHKLFCFRATRRNWYIEERYFTISLNNDMLNFSAIWSSFEFFFSILDIMKN